jgi:hypothetical protein
MIDAEGLGAYDSVALYAESYTDDGFVARFDHVIASTGDALDPQPPDGPVTSAAPASALLSRVPAEFRDQCRSARPDTAGGQVEAVLCSGAGAAETAEYYRYGSLDALVDAFDLFNDESGADPDGESCTTGSAIRTYSIGGEDAGALACYEDPRGRGLSVHWFDGDLLILAFGTVDTDDYGELFAWWADAGPVR